MYITLLKTLVSKTTSGYKRGDAYVFVYLIREFYCSNQKHTALSIGSFDVKFSHKTQYITIRFLTKKRECKLVLLKRENLEEQNLIYSRSKTTRSFFYLLLK